MTPENFLNHPFGSVSQSCESEIDPNWEAWQPNEYVENLKHPIADRGFKSDFDAMKWADCCVMVLPCGRSAHTEAGWMKGAGKEVHVFMPTNQEPELMYKIYDSVMTEFDQFKFIGAPKHKMVVCADCNYKHNVDDRLEKTNGFWTTYHCPKCNSESTFKNQ